MKIRHRRDLWKLFTPPVPGGAAEIGVAEGLFSADLLAMPCQFPVVYMVDRWRSVPSQKGDAANSQAWHDKNMAEAIARVAKYGDRAIQLRGNSTEMADSVANNSLALVYVDCDHSYDGVRDDIRAWFPKLMSGGVMAFHDYENPGYGVKQAVKDFCLNRYEIHLLPEDKQEDAGAYILC